MDDPNKKRYYFKHLDFPGYWRIIWFGRLSRLSEGSGSTSIHVYLGQLTCSEKLEFTHPLKYERVDLPIGEFPVLYIGAVLKDGHLLLAEELSSKSVNTNFIGIDLTKDNTRAIPRTAKDDIGQIIPMNQQWGFFREPQADSYLLGFSHNDNPYGIIIPCAEILRFFYCYASNIARVMTSDRILNPDRYLYDCKKSFFDKQTGVVTLKPRLSVSDSSAFFLANFVSGNFDLGRAQQIPKQVAVHSRTDPERPFVAYPPLDGTFTINAACHTIDSHLGKQIIVTRIVSIDLKPNFSALAMGASKGEKRRQHSSAGRTRNIVNNPSDLPVKLNQGAVNPALGAEECFDDELGMRFPNMMEVVRIPASKGKTKGGLCGGVINTEHPDSSTNDRGSSKSKLHRTIILPDGSKTDSENNENSSAFGRIVKVLGLIKSTYLAEVEFLSLTQLTQESNDSENHVVYNLPKIGHEEPWAYIDRDANRRRKIVIASVVNKQAKRYLIEFEQRFSGECSTLILWDSDNYVPKEDILLAVEECIKNNASYLDNPSFEHSWSKLRHSWTKNEHLNPSHFLDRIFSAQSLMKAI